MASNEARVPPFLIAIIHLGKSVLGTKLGIYDKFEPYIARASAMRADLQRDNGRARSPWASEEFTARLASAFKCAQLTLSMIDRLEADPRQDC